MRRGSGLRARLRHRLVLEQYRLGARFLPLLPDWLVDGGTRLLAGALALRRSEQRLIVERNLRRTAPDGAAPSGAALRRAVRETFVAYGRYYVDCARLAAASPAEVDAGFTFEDYDNISDALRMGPGAILALPHVGSWEWAGVWLAQRPGTKVTAVVETIEHPELFAWMERFRRRIGMEIVPAGPGALGALTHALHDGHVVCLLTDRDIGGGGVEVEFFGETTTLPGGAAVLARRTGSPIVGVVVRRRGGKCHAKTYPPVLVSREGRLRQVVAEATQDLAHLLEDMIRPAPTQWHLMQPNWPSDREAVAALRSGSGATAGARSR
ncbi:MAG: phosphatidylinositol mannoside acyltransferase [bacterium]|nr:phosphatidylinositol mannoside acyltransferase [bacterium]MCY3951741.1 phosphatidylinositol mannoside acyltransferase [bacterium]MCY4104921.1 phosphatidylinositol mannoside acyltransferase [bacterium]